MKKNFHSWNLKGFIRTHLLVAIGIIIFIFFRNSVLFVDLKVFKLLNSSIKDSVFLQSFWSVLNHKAADWIGDGVMLVFFLIYIFKKSCKARIAKWAELILFTICLSTIILFVNTYLFRHPLRFERKSPSLVVEEAVRVRKNIRWIKTKDSSNHSFPGDHATTAIMFALFFAYFARSPLGYFGIAYGCIMSLPRLILGAHWLSDILVGSLSIALLIFSWVILTPIYGCFLKGYSQLVLSMKQKLITKVNLRSPESLPNSSDLET